MRKTTTITLIISFTASFLGAVNGFCQGLEHYDTLQKERKFTVNLGLTFQDHFDENAVIQWWFTKKLKPFTPGWLAWLNEGGDASLEYEVGEKLSLGLSFNWFGAGHYDDTNRIGPAGRVLWRRNRLVTFYTSYNLLEYNQIVVSALAGGTFRWGRETLLASYGVFDVHVLGLPLKDIGVCVGASVHRDIWKDRVRLAAQARYNYFVYRHETGRNSPYEWNNGSSTQMLSYIFTVGYRF